MPAAHRLKPRDIFTQEEWQALSARQSWRGPALVLHAWGIIFLAIALVALWPNPFTFLLAVALVGARQLGISILMHEAAHGALHPNKAVNDFLGHWFCAAPVGASLAAYRAYHLPHHKYVQQPEDPDLVLSAPFPVSKASIKRKIIRDLTGQTFLRQRLATIKALKNSTNPPPNEIEDAAKIQAQVLAGKKALRDHLGVNLVLLLGFISAGVWWAYPFIWIVSLATWFPFVTRIRNIAEHAGIPDSEDPLAHARTTHARWWERLLVAPYWVHYHSEHHAFMHLPCYRLPLAHKMLRQKGFADRIPQKDSYWDVIKAVTV